MGTAQSLDGFHPCHYSWLCDDALAVVGLILAASEAIGLLPTDLAWILYVFIPKAGTKPGFRPIALLCSLFKVWARLRSPTVDAILAMHDRPYIACGKQRVAFDAVLKC